MKKKLLSCAALMAACLAVSMPIGAKENPWSHGAIIVTIGRTCN